MIIALSESNLNDIKQDTSMYQSYKAFSLTLPASMLIYWNKRKYLHEKRVQLPEDSWVHQHGRRFIVLEHRYGRRDVMWKRSIIKLKDPNLRIIRLRLHYTR